MPALNVLLPGRAYRWNFTVLGLDFSLFILSLSFVSAYGVMPLFVHHLTASNLALGAIAAVRAAGTSLPPIFAAAHIERLARKKPYALFMTTFERLPYLVLALAIPPLAANHPVLLLWLFFALTGVATMFGGLGLPAWLDLIARMLPPDWRGRFFGFGAALGGLLGVVGAGIAALLLQRYDWPAGFALCFGCTSLTLAISYVFFILSREPAQAIEERRHADDRGVWRRLPAIVHADHNFARYLAATALISAAGMATSFYTIDAERTMHLSDADAGIYAVVLLAAATLGNIGWGYLGDHIGHKRVVEGGTLCTGLAALLALLVGPLGLGPLGYGVVFVLVGLATSGIQLAALTFVIDFAPAEQRPTYVGLSNLASVPFTAGAPLLAGLVADRAGLPTVFALSVALALAGVFIVWRGVVDPRMQAPRAPAA